MFGTLKTHDDQSYAIEKCHHGHVIKEFDLTSFEDFEIGDELTEGNSSDYVLETQEDRVEDTTTIVT